MRRIRRVLVGLMAPVGLTALVGLTAGCSAVSDPVARLTEGLGYYWQSIAGHVAVMRRAEPVDELMVDARVDPRLRERLALARRIRRFAVDELALPDNGSYTRFADLGRPFVTWGVVAAPALSLQLRQWCFPVAGCVTYRGYYAQADAEAYARRLEAEGLDVQVSGVPAYSTLGWLDDPLLSTFINYPEAELARLVFHELSHQVVYVKGDSMFNESFATAVEQIGVERWLAHRGSAEQRLAWLQRRARRQQFLDLLSRHRDRLAEIYSAPVDEDAKRAGKAAVFQSLRSEYARLRDGPWQGFTGYDRWFNRPLGNAHLGAIATYTTWAPAFQQLFAESGQDFDRFYLRVASIAALDPAERRAALARRLPMPDGPDLPELLDPARTPGVPGPPPDPTTAPGVIAGARVGDRRTP